MNPSSSSSFSSPPLFKSNSRPQSSTNRETPSIIPLDYNYQIMAPSSLRPQTSRYHLASRSSNRESNPDVDVDIDEDLPYSSLFGDLVPPPPPDDFLGSTFQTSHFSRSTSVDVTSEEENALRQNINVNNSRIPQRLFSQVPYTTLMGRRFSNSLSQTNFEVMPTSIPRLKPPDIQILPNSSNGSSSDPQNSPNYLLLAPQDIIRKSSVYEPSGDPEDVSELKETFTISDGHSMREFMQSTTRKSGMVEETRDMEMLSPPQDIQSNIPRQFSNESYSSGEWFRSGSLDYPEFNKMPKLRPSSKNVMSIKRDEMPMCSPVAAMINDSNGSSSGEERLMEVTQILDKPTVCLDCLKPPERPPSPSPSCLRSLEETIVLTPREYIKQRRKSIYTPQMVDQELQNIEAEDKPPPIPPMPHLTDDDLNKLNTHIPLTSDRSPVILKDSITTGGDFRVDQGRLHKKTSFTIISEKSPQSSQVQSPRFQRSREHTLLSLIPPTKPMDKTKNYIQRKSLSSTQLKLPHLLPPSTQQDSIDDSPRPSVQFDMTGRYSPSKLPPQKGILHHKESLTSSQDTLLPHHMRRRSSILPSIIDNKTKPHVKSCEALPLITDPYRTAIPRLNRSALDLRPETAVFPPGALPRPLKPNPNPTRKQKGLLKILNHQELLSKIPPKSNWSSMDDLWLDRKRKASLLPLQNEKMDRRRSSSTSPSRRSSTQTASDRRSSYLSSVTTSDFSFRRPSTSAKPKTPQTQRKRPVFQLPSPASRRKSSSTSSLVFAKTGRSSRTKIAKPTTLSPIIGTPNKDSSSIQSPMHSRRPSLAPPSDILSDTTSRRDSLSKIPIRSQAESRSNSRLSSHGGSRTASRAASPVKDYPVTGGRLSQMATSRSGSRASQHAPSQPESRAQSRANSRTPSRSTSRASTRPISLPGSRPSSRIDQAKDISNSRSNSRLSQHSSKRFDSISPQVGRKTPTIPASSGRRKSVSLSPQEKRRAVSRRGSISPIGLKANGRTRSRSKTHSSPDRLSRSRIPVSHPNGSSSTKSPPSKKKPTVAADLRRTSSLKAKTKNTSKQPASAKKMPTSVRKTETSVKRTASSVGKQVPPTFAQQTSTIKKLTAFKREPSNATNKPATLNVKPSTRESSSTNMKKKQPSSKTPTLGKKNAQNVPGDKKVQDKSKESSSKTEKPSTSVKEQKNNETVVVTKKTGDKSAGTSTTGTPKVAAGVKRQPSSVSLIRVSSKISLLKKRSDSSLSKNTLDSSIPELPITNQSRASSPTKPHTDMAALEGGTSPAAIIEKSQKTLENIQKTVTEATDEIHKTIKENLTDLRSLEQDMGLTSDSAGSPTPSVTTVVEKKSNSRKQGGGAAAAGESVSRLGTAEDPSATSAAKSPLPPSQPIEASVSVINPDKTQSATPTAGSNGSTQVDAAATAAQAAERVSERAISVMPEVDCESANFQSYNGATAGNAGDDKVMSGSDAGAMTVKPTTGSIQDFESEPTRRSPDGQGSQGGSAKGSGSQEYLEDKSLEDEEATPKGCCRCCAKFCMPCRRLRCSRCCQRKKSSKHDAEAEQPVLSATSSATTTHLEIVDEKTTKKTSCWQKLNCCKSCSKKSKGMDSTTEIKKEIIKEEATKIIGPPKQSACGLCLSKIFCCRSVNKIDPKTGDELDVKKCCFCIPCRKKRSVNGLRDSAVSSAVGGGSSVAWEDPERDMTTADAHVLEGQPVEPRPGCCKRFCNFLLCCRKKKVQVSDSRRASIRAPPPEDNRRKLHNDLIEFNSKMKGAIPVLPLWLAWFCFLCNIIVPGLGTLLSGLFCICLGIPRFSQYDSAKARFGSFIINTIVAVSQLFCVLFCFVGWGWSIWWGTIMLKCARKLSKIRKVEKLEIEEEKRQAAAAEAAAALATKTTAVGAAETEPAKS